MTLTFPLFFRLTTLSADRIFPTRFSFRLKLEGLISFRFNQQQIIPLWIVGYTVLDIEETVAVSVASPQVGHVLLLASTIYHAFRCLSHL